MSSTTAEAALTDRDREFLSVPRLGYLTVATRTAEEFPAPRPVWFELTPDSAVQLFTGATSPKVHRIRQDPRASMVVGNNVAEPEYWVAATGPATVEPDGGGELASRLASRYWDLSDPENAAALDGILAADLVRIVIRPERINRYGG